jgi:hypothetical protein
LICSPRTCPLAAEQQLPPRAPKEHFFDARQVGLEEEEEEEEEKEERTV